jgi:hypothetical protein
MIRRMIRPTRELLCALSCAAALLLAAGPAEARSAREARYSFEQAWSTAIRHLRVNEGFAITEKDEDVGYVVFTLKDDGKVFAGALEVIRFKDRGRPAVRLVLTIEDRPSYMEDAILERMLGKLREEHGEPPAPSPPGRGEKDEGKKKGKVEKG